MEQKHDIWAYGEAHDHLVEQQSASMTAEKGASEVRFYTGSLLSSVTDFHKDVQHRSMCKEATAARNTG